MKKVLLSLLMLGASTSFAEDILNCVYQATLPDGTRVSEKKNIVLNRNTMIIWATYGDIEISGYIFDRDNLPYRLSIKETVSGAKADMRVLQKNQSGISLVRLVLRDQEHSFSCNFQQP